MPIVNLTQQFIREGLICPPEKSSISYYCKAVGGFCINVSRGKPHRGLYRFQHKVNGKTVWTKIGSTDDMTLDAARAKALEIKRMTKLLPKHAAPAPEAPKAMPTLSAYFKLYYLPYAKPRKRSWRRDEEMFRLRIEPVFGGMLLSEIQRKAVQTFQAALRDDGLAPATADHHVKLLRYMLNLAVEWEVLEKNPIAGVRLFNVDNKVENLLSPEQMAGLMNVLEMDRNRPICRIAIYLLSTGARLSEALNAKWEHVDLERRTWRIPATNAKSKRPRSVPLNDSALSILHQVKTSGVHDHIFVNVLTGKPYTTMMKVWARLRRQAGLPHLRIHDLRHSFASMLVSSGRTLYEVQTILGHSDPKVTMRYGHMQPNVLLEAANAASVLAKPALAKVA